jgi:aspartate/methionine/tyrosine aminotransferase
VRVASRALVPPFEVMAVLDRVAHLRGEGRDIVSLCAGEPSQGAPADVHALAVAQHRDRLALTYTPALGLPDLRAELAGHYRRWYGLDVDPSEVGVLTGASGAFVAVFLAAFEPGDRVALVRPGYPAYRNLLRSLGAEVVEIGVGPDTGFQPTPDLLDRAHHEAPLAGLVLASPANPTGSMVTRDELTAIAGWCADHDVRLVSDEIYHGITYGPDGARAEDRGTSAWEIDRRSVVVSSFSKYWGMTGWRLGWALLPEDLRGPVDALVGNAALCAPTPAQHAALGAFTEASYVECDARVEAFAATRRLLLERVPALGWGPIAPADGAFYLWAGIGGCLGPHRNAAEWCRALLEEAGVALVPGTDFDPIDGGAFVRLSFAAGTDAVAEALDRIEAWQRRSAGAA